MILMNKVNDMNITYTEEKKFTQEQVQALFFVRRLGIRRISIQTVQSIEAFIDCDYCMGRRTAYWIGSGT